MSAGLIVLVIKDDQGRYLKHGYEGISKSGRRLTFTTLIEDAVYFDVDSHMDALYRRLQSITSVPLSIEQVEILT